MIGERKYYAALDITKFVMAIMILLQHTSNEWTHSVGIVHAFFGLGNFAVPFFFACSGFLFFSKLKMLEEDERKQYYWKWTKRIGLMYLVWSLIYFCFVFYGWLENGFSSTTILDWIHKALVFTTYATIWFLPALWLGVTICYTLYRYSPTWLMWLVLAFLLVIGNLFGSYNNLLTGGVARFNEWYMSVFVTWRNGLFNGAPFVAVGMLLAISERHIHIKKAFLLTLVFGALFLFEAFAITRYHFSTATDQGFMMAPCVFFLMAGLIQLEIPARETYVHLRNYSMLVFLGQRLFLTAIPSVLPECYIATIKSWPEPIIYLFFLSLVLLFAILVERLSGKYRFLKVLW